MDTEKSIKLMKVIKEILPDDYSFDFGKEEIDEIIKRLQMWEDFKEKHGNEFFHNDEKWTAKLSLLMDEFEEKYYPKSKIYRTIEVQVTASNEEVVDELSKNIEEMNGRIFNKGKITVDNVMICN